MGLLKDVFLTDSVEIKASCEEVFSFFRDLEANYTRWHPQDHVLFKWVKGNGLEQGAVAYSEQYIHGKLHKLKVEFTRVAPPREVEFKFLPAWIRIFVPEDTWVLTPTGQGCRFTATTHLRMGRLSQRLNRKKLESLARHLGEEGQNLKRLVEGKAEPSAQPGKG